MGDPFSAAAGAAGVISLAFQLFGGCIQGFVLLSTARNLPKDAATLVCLLDLEELHLTNWAGQAGLLTGERALDPRLNAVTVENTLRRLRHLLLDSDQLRDRYGLRLAQAQHVTSSQTKGQADEDDESLSGSLRVLTGVSDDMRKRILARAGMEQSTRNIFKRLRWAAVDKDKGKELVNDVHALVRELWHLIEPWQHDDVRAIGLNMVALNGKFDQLMSLADALKHSPHAAADMPQTASEQTNGLVSIGVSAEVKALRVGLGDGVATPENSLPHRPRLLEKLEPLSRPKLNGFAPLKKDAFTGIAEYDEKKVFVEYKVLNPLLRSKILPRVQNLAALLNLDKARTFRSLTCRGLIEDGDKVCFVFRHPCPEQPVEPRTLLDLFSAKDGIEPPSLTDRLGLAVRVAQTLQAFHRVGWLHKSLRSQNILFFPQAPSTPEGGGAGRALGLVDPLLAGFAFSRLGSPSEVSEQPSADAGHDIYRHPDALGEPTAGFTAAMDAYSLGTVLLEIAEWRALRYLVEGVVGNVDDERGVPLSRVAAVREFLLSGRGKGGTSKLRTKMGDIYHDACLMCLRGKLLEGEDVEGWDTLSAPTVLDIAVRKLESCRV